MNPDDYLGGWTPVAHYRAVKLFIKRLIYGRKYSKSGDWFFQDHVLEKQAYREWSERNFKLNRAIYSVGIPKELLGREHESPANHLLNRIHKGELTHSQAIAEIWACSTCENHTTGCNDEGIICSFHKNRSKYPYDAGWDNPAPTQEFMR